MSPSQRAVDKVGLGIYVPQELKYRLQKKAALIGVDLTSLVTAILIQHTQDVVLTADDLRRIAEKIERKRNS